VTAQRFRVGASALLRDIDPQAAADAIS